MKNYKTLMANIDQIIADRDKKGIVTTAGLLSPNKAITPKKDIKEDDVTYKIADYISAIRKQRQELVK